MHVNLCHKVPRVVELSPAVRLVSIGRVKVGHRVGSMREYSLLVWLWASSTLWYCKILVHYSVVCYQFYYFLVLLPESNKTKRGRELPGPN